MMQDRCGEEIACAKREKRDYDHVQFDAEGKPITYVSVRGGKAQMPRVCLQPSALDGYERCRSHSKGRRCVLWRWHKLFKVRHKYNKEMV